ncbi:polyphosphate polymerase domain-containing protein [Cellulosilyticum sp. I15G10I2]|uniref:polyphosphate polymerase domain-containing protein n=1 Tax=Cellulosilyticum sp. I15G10I2 TaxID=1892843 RepID=UPI00085CBEBA|nr:polyphosphate polymerase domain-containing protein [Cellulosilyticum sp. I15G10I2]
MGIEVFNRYENKFLLDDKTYEQLQGYLCDYMEHDKYNKENGFYTISNIYYDTADNHLIRSSLEKPKYKEKLRLRAYGVPNSDSEGYLEIKKKVCGLVNKRRTTLKLDEAYEFVNTGIKPDIKDYMNEQVINEIEYILKRYTLEPKLYLAYDRTAMFSRECSDLRITFDTNIRTRRYDLKLECGDYGEKLLEDNRWLMEVKAKDSIPIWLSKLLSECKAYKASFSKYGTQHKKTVANAQHMKGDLNTCLKQYSA